MIWRTPAFATAARCCAYESMAPGGQSLIKTDQLSRAGTRYVASLRHWWKTAQRWLRFLRPWATSLALAMKSSVRNGRTAVDTWSWTRRRWATLARLKVRRNGLTRWPVGSASPTTSTLPSPIANSLLSGSSAPAATPPTCCSLPEDVPRYQPSNCQRVYLVSSLPAGILLNRATIKPLIECQERSCHHVRLHHRWRRFGRMRPGQSFE